MPDFGKNQHFAAFIPLLEPVGAGSGGREEP